MVNIMKKIICPSCKQEILEFREEGNFSKLYKIDKKTKKIKNIPEREVIINLSEIYYFCSNCGKELPQEIIEEIFERYD